MSHAHADIDAARQVVRWLTDWAGLKVWWDEDELLAGRALAGALTDGIESARSTICLISHAWVESSWCEDEWNAALQEVRADRRYRALAVQLDDVQIPKFLRNARFLPMQQFSVEMATALLHALVAEPAPWVGGERDVYFSRSWRPGESITADLVCKVLQGFAFRVIGDSPDNKSYDVENRIRKIVESCGALVAALPFREDADEHGFTSRFILDEILVARSLHRPVLLFIEDGVNLDNELIAETLGRRAFPMPACAEDPHLQAAISLLEEEYTPSPCPACAFFATSLTSNRIETRRVKSLIERVTAIECHLGQDLKGAHAQQAIVERIQNAQFVLADISESNLNALIEAGIARGAGTALHLMSMVPEDGDLRTRFMFRDLEVCWYKGEVEKIGIVHCIARHYRRKVFGVGHTG